MYIHESAHNRDRRYRYGPADRDVRDTGKHGGESPHGILSSAVRVHPLISCARHKQSIRTAELVTSTLSLAGAEGREARLADVVSGGASARR